MPVGLRFWGWVLVGAECGRWMPVGAGGCSMGALCR